MKKILNILKDNLKLPNVIIRLITSYLLFNILNSIKYKNIYTISFSQNYSIPIIILLITLIFVILTIISCLIRKDKFDFLILVLSLLVCSIMWILYETNIFLILLLFFLFLIIYKYKPKYFSIFNIKKDKTAKIIVIIFGVILFAAISILLILRHKTFSTPTYDFGIFVQNFHYLETKLIPFSTVERNKLLSHLAVHISPIFYLILPIYYMIPSPLTLQVITALALASGLIPIYLLCKKRKLNNIIIVLISIIYSIYAPLICGTSFDFHENVFLTPLLLWLFYLSENQKKLPYYIILAITLMIKEDVAIYTSIFAIYLLFNKDYKKGIWTLIISIVYFIITTTLLSKLGEGVMFNRFNNLAYEDASMLGIIKTILVNPRLFLQQIIDGDTLIPKLTYLIQLLLPLGFVPLLNKKYNNYILLSPILINIMTMYVYSYNIDFHYSFAIIAFLMYVFIINIKELKIKEYLYICLIASILVTAGYVYPKYKHYIKAYNEKKEEFIEIEKILKTIDKDASVNASTFLVSHLADRDELYEIYYHGIVDDVDYVVIEVQYEEKDVAKEYKKLGYKVYKKYEDKLLILTKD